MNSKEIKGNLSIYRIHSGGETNFVEIELKDVASVVELLRLRMNLTDFAQALMGLASGIGLLLISLSTMILLPRILISVLLRFILS